MEPDVAKALAFLVAGILNSHLLTHEGDCEDPCCPTCCAPCGALDYFRTGWTQELAAAFVAWETGWDWCNPDGTLKWELIEAHWDRAGTQCHQGFDL